MLYRVHLAWAGFELTTLVVIDTDCNQPMETSNSIDFWQVREVADGILQYLDDVESECMIKEQTAIQKRNSMGGGARSSLKYVSFINTLNLY